MYESYERALFKVIHYFGSQTALARILGVKQQTISYWLNHENTIPYGKVLQIFILTKGKVTYHALAPHEKEVNKVLDIIIETNSGENLGKLAAMFGVEDNISLKSNEIEHVYIKPEKTGENHQEIFKERDHM